MLFPLRNRSNKQLRIIIIGLNSLFNLQVRTIPSVVVHDVHITHFKDLLVLSELTLVLCIT